MTSHPVDLGDLPAEVLFSCCSELLPLNRATVQKHWRERYPFFVRRKCGLFVLVKEADLWLDQRGKALFSESLLHAKRKRNPGWRPAGDDKVVAPTLPLLMPSTAIKPDFGGETKELVVAA